jgi:hypothetical protein
MQAFPAIPPRKYVEKMVVEFSGEQAAVIHDALKKARKESGFSDRASLVTYLAKAFLDGGPGGKVQNSKKPPYQVVIHHHPRTGVAWTEAEKGIVYVPDAEFDRVLCDAEIMELPTTGAEEKKGEHQPMTAKMSKEGGIQEGSSGISYNGCGEDVFIESEHPREKLNRLYKVYRDRARAGKESKSDNRKRCHPTGTISPALREKVMFRDGGRCPPCGGRQVPGCGRSHFLQVHHIRAQGAGGGHSPENILAICSSCHTLVLEGRLTIEGEMPDRFVGGRK